MEPQRASSMGRRGGWRALWWLMLACGCVALLALRAPKSRALLPPGTRVDRLVVYKNQHFMEAYSDGVRVAVYPVAVGRGGAGPKLYEGDGRTPEGVYRVDSRHHSARFRRFLHLSYPNAEDERRYRDARAAGRIPDDIGIGGDVGIHGESDRAVVRWTRNQFDWTAGCVAVSDAAIDELYSAVQPNAVVEIHADAPAADR